MNKLEIFLHNWLVLHEPLISKPSPLLILAVILVVGSVFSRLGKKIKLPSITSQIIGGIFIGHYILNVFPSEAYESFNQITKIALGFVGLLIGSHLNFRKLANAKKRVISIVLADAFITPLLVFFVLYFVVKLELIVSLLLGVLSLLTAPGSTLHVIKEKKAKGLVSKTLLAVVALNNVLTILLFYTIYYYMYSIDTYHEIHLISIILRPIYLLLESFIIGGLTGFTVIYFTEKRKSTTSFLGILIISVVLTVGTSETLHFSGILSSLILGIVIGNFSRYKKLLFNSFKDIEKEVFSLFFVLAGTHLDFHAIVMAKYAGFAFVISRIFGKYFGATLGTYINGSTRTLKKWMGFTLFPFAGLAIGMLLLIENMNYLAPYTETISAIVLTAVLVFELLGPISTGFAIEKAGESNKNRVRLMDFLQEEYIMVNFESNNKWDALENLAEFLHRSHHLQEITVEELKKSLIEREKDISTGIGDNLAIPHAIINGGPKIRGVIAVSKKGIPFDSFDGKPVNVFFLIATPKDNYDLHLQVLANIAKIFGHHPEIKEKMINAKSSAEVFEILQTEEVENYNPFFET